MGFGDFLGGLVDAGADIVDDVADGDFAGALETLGGIGDDAEAFIDGLTGDAEAFLDGLSQDAEDFLGGLADDARDLVEDAGGEAWASSFGKVVDWASDRGGELAGTVQSSFDKVTDWATDKGGELAGQVQGSFDDAVGWVSDKANAAVDEVQSRVEGAVDWANDTVDDLQDGGLQGMLEFVLGGPGASLGGMLGEAGFDIGDVSADDLVGGLIGAGPDGDGAIDGLLGSLGPAADLFEDPRGAFTSLQGQVQDVIDGESDAFDKVLGLLEDPDAGGEIGSFVRDLETPKVADLVADAISTGNGQALIDQLSIGDRASLIDRLVRPAPTTEPVNDVDDVVDVVGSETGDGSIAPEPADDVLGDDLVGADATGDGEAGEGVIVTDELVVEETTTVTESADGSMEVTSDVTFEEVVTVEPAGGTGMDDLGTGDAGMGDPGEAVEYTEPEPEPEPASDFDQQIEAADQVEESFDDMFDDLG